MSVQKKVVETLFTSVFLLSMLLGTEIITPVSASTTHNVYPGQSIQAAINAAQPGDTIFVHAGTYYEHVAVKKSVSLIGENRTTTIIDGNGTGVLLWISASNVVVSGFTVQNGNWGIFIEGSRGITLRRNNMTGNKYNFGMSYIDPSLSDFINDIDSSNTVDGKPIYYWIDQHDK